MWRASGRAFVLVCVSRFARGAVGSRSSRCGRRSGNRTPEPASTESTIPPDLAVTVRQQHEGRALTVITLAEVAALLLMAEGKITGTKWDGDATYSGRQMGEGAAADIVRSGYPLDTPLAADVKPAALAF